MNQQHYREHDQVGFDLDQFCQDLRDATYSFASEAPYTPTEQHLQRMLDFSIAHFDRIVLYDMAGAGARPPFVVSARSVCRERVYPIETVRRRERFRVDGAIVFALENFPFHGFTVMDERGAEVAGAILSQLKLPFNLIASYGEMIIVPRTREQEERGCLCSAYDLTTVTPSSVLSACGISAACQKLLEAKLNNYFAAHRQFML